MGALMATANCSIPTEFAAAPSRDAVDGLAAIASALDQGLVGAPYAHGKQFLDICAIALGWALLIAVVLHPELQLFAIGLGTTAFALRSVWRIVLGTTQQTGRIPASPHVLQYR